MCRLVQVTVLGTLHLRITFTLQPYCIAPHIHVFHPVLCFSLFFLTSLSLVPFSLSFLLFHLSLSLSLSSLSFSFSLPPLPLPHLSPPLSPPSLSPSLSPSFAPGAGVDGMDRIKFCSAECKDRVPLICENIPMTRARLREEMGAAKAALAGRGDAGSAGGGASCSLRVATPHPAATRSGGGGGAGKEGTGAGAGGSSIGRLGRLVVFGGIVAATLLGAERFKKAYQ